MPELPEVETIKRGIEPILQSQVIENITIRQHQLRWRINEQIPRLLKNQQIVSISRRAKYLLITLDYGTIIIHLGMSGSLRLLTNKQEPTKHDHVDFTFKNGTILRYNDPRRFGAILWTDSDPHQHKLLIKLGPEPLGRHFNGHYLYDSIQTRTVTIKQAIMNSHIVVGVGNIYANEALFKAGIRPDKKANTIGKEKITLLCKQIKSTLKAAIKSGGTTLKNFSNSDGKPGYFSQKLSVYGRKNLPCVTCGKTLSEIRIDNRSTVFCRGCQR